MLRLPLTCRSVMSLLPYLLHSVRVTLLVVPLTRCPVSDPLSHWPAVPLTRCPFGPLSRCLASC
jgi:hypothetical protein